MADRVDYNALGQAIDTSWGRSSTPKSAQFSVKFSIAGTNRLIATYATIVNFVTEREMILLKRRYNEDSDAIVAEALKLVKKTYQNLAGSSLAVKEVHSNDGLEILGTTFHNPKRTAYYKKTIIFEIA